MCGEKFPQRDVAMIYLGSPPHVRGKENLQRGQCNHGRITPACAGKRAPAVPSGRGRRDHPRMCGEKPLPQPDKVPGGTSPPHVRGKAAD